MMLDKVRKYIAEWQMIQKEDCVIVGVSGGADSICLLFVLLELQKEIGFDIVAVHVNHGLRGADADADEAYVKCVCEEAQVRFLSYFENVELIAKKRKQSTEEAGRYVRRAFLEQALRECGGTKIALAHHKNDNAETFLMNLSRGTGLKGLGGIWPVQGNVVRPLLSLERREIEEYLDARGIPYCIDKTNAEDDYTRNRVRNHVIPAMEREINGKVVAHIDETMNYLRTVQNFLEEQAAVYWEQCVVLRENSFFLLEEVYEKVPSAIKPLILKRMLSETAGQEKDLEAVHLRDLEGLLEKQTGRKLDLPYHMEARRVYEGLQIRKKGSPKDKKRYEITWRVGGIDEIKKSSVENSGTKWFDYDIIQNGVSFRTRRTGDYITINGEGQTQKMKSYFINEKIPKEQRDDILLVADGSHILWVFGYRVNCAYRVTEHTKRILEIQINEGE